MLLRMENFKSVDSLSLELGPLTILLGPPASGKSNILDAIALLGYFNRLLLLDREYDGNETLLEPLTAISRFEGHQELFRYHDLTKRIEIRLDGPEEMGLEVGYEQGKIGVKLNGSPIPWDLKTLKQGSLQGARNALRQIAGDGLLTEARLYGYDRYGLAASSCPSPLHCGFHLRLKGLQPRPVPKNIMSELGWNVQTVIKKVQDVVILLNRALAELDEKVEVKVLKSGRVVVFDYDYEVDSSAVSDTIFRALYYLMAVRTAMNYAKMYGLEKKFILLLEEPGAHVFPYYLDLLADSISEAVKAMNVVIATHNPVFVSMLWDRIGELKTYYVVRDEYGSTRAHEIDIDKLAEELRTADDLLFASPRDILSGYVKGVSHAECSR